MVITKDGIIDNGILLPIPFHVPNGRHISDTEKAELKARWFWGDEDWIRMKKELDKCLSFRKSIKGKPTEEQMIDIEINRQQIADWNRVCFLY